MDDSLDELRLLSDMLRAEHFRLTVATDGRAGYQRAVVSQPDVILLDVAMPQIDGFGTCRLLKADPATRHIPVIFLTARNAPEERLRGLQLGGVDYVAKPVLAAEVVARIRIHLSLRGARPAQTPAPGAADPDEVLFEAATREIRDHLDCLPAVPDIAQRLGTYDKKLGQIFRRRLGMTVSAFIGEERIRLARRLLDETPMTVEQIALHVGFGTGANFTTAFRKRMGMTPTHYRQAMRALPDEDA
ncbi:MAG: helix-turn-helix domain-containing protein [Azospira sp.]|nr:helix-turn-helix domain-containing protein [Azospira sp.]